MTVASRELVYVHVMTSPGSTVRLAVAPVTVPSEHTRLVSDQRAGTPSVTVLAPNPVPDTVNVRVDGSVGSVSSSRLNGPKLPVKAKSWAALGTASLTIVTVASFLFVKVQVMASPGSTVTVAVSPATVPSVQSTVSVQPAGTASVTVLVPKAVPDTVKVRLEGSVGSVSSSRPNGPKLPVKAKS